MSESCLINFKCYECKENITSNIYYNAWNKQLKLCRKCARVPKVIENKHSVLLKRTNKLLKLDKTYFHCPWCNLEIKISSLYGHSIGSCKWGLFTKIDSGLIMINQVTYPLVMSVDDIIDVFIYIVPYGDRMYYIFAINSFTIECNIEYIHIKWKLGKNKHTRKIKVLHPHNLLTINKIYSSKNSEYFIKYIKDNNIDQNSILDFNKVY